MDKNLIAYVEQQNFTAAIFKSKVYDVNNLTAEDKQELLRQLECDLSPENLCCDGELSGAPLRKKARMLNGAKAALEKL